MVNVTQLQKIEKFFNKEVIKETVNNLIFKNEDGSYVLFDKYLIIHNKKNYELSIKQYHGTTCFYSLKNATIYAILHNNKKYSEAQRIVEIDKKFEGIDFSILHLNNMIKKSKITENKLIYTSKLSQDLANKEMLRKELRYYEKLAQAKQFHIYGLISKTV